MYTHVSLDDRTDTQREHRRQLSRERKRRQRQRQGDGIKHVAVYYGPVVVEALIARSRDAGMTEEKADRAARSAKQVAADLANILHQWASRYLAERDQA
jgi:hypothetical protein